MDPELRKAAEEGDAVMLTAILSANSPDVVYSVTPIGYNTALHIAASNGHLTFVHHFLFNMSIDVELIVSWNSDGETPVHLAVRVGHLEVVRQLVQYDVAIMLLECTEEITMNVNVGHIASQNTDGDTPLHLAVRGRHQLLVDRLLQDYSYSLETALIRANKQGNTPLHEALFNQMTDTALQLLDINPRCGYIQNSTVESPFLVAFWNGLDDVVNKIAAQGLSLDFLSALHKLGLGKNIGKHIFKYVFPFC
ncbi:hypothetical protein E2562_035209 [Oryza meyeriana var. granulata]|uniref:Uncharacterized protein n=1 Tax=Oryza meyeriana var. granulata TaxID=110450 RepID=A0A6G1DRW3_9ORYZ|nr:hypothetical protein E2562_035209 [Oryza meyeriana var. granulata]